MHGRCCGLLALLFVTATGGRARTARHLAGPSWRVPHTPRSVLLSSAVERSAPEPPSSFGGAAAKATAGAETETMPLAFAEYLRDAAPYIAMHRSSQMVFHLPGEAIDNEAEFGSVMDDIALLNLLGVQVVIVVGIRSQIATRLAQLGVAERFVGATRITDAAAMRVVKEMAGFARSQVESAMARGLTRVSWRGNGGAPSPLQPREASTGGRTPAGDQADRQEDKASAQSPDDPALPDVVASWPSLPSGRRPVAVPPTEGGGGGAHGSRPLRGVEVISSNSIYTARPIGVRGGVDFGYSGEVRKVNGELLLDLLRKGWVVLATPLGYSASGEVYNCNSHELACELASQIGAAKLVFYTPQRWKLRRSGPGPSRGPRKKDMANVQSMRMHDAEAIVKNFRAWQRAGARDPDSPSADKERPVVDAAGTPLSLWRVLPSDEATPRGDLKLGPEPNVVSFVQLCAWSARALSRGVRRAHLIAPLGGEALEELYTSGGRGLLIARDVYEGFRPACAGDIPKIVDLIAPLEERGILAKRGREVIEADVELGRFHVLERDGQVLACGILTPIPTATGSPPDSASPGGALPSDAVSAEAGGREAVSEWAELGCLAVNPRFRKEGRGDAMLGYLQRTAYDRVRSGFGPHCPCLASPPVLMRARPLPPAPVPAHRGFAGSSASRPTPCNGL